MLLMKLVFFCSAICFVLTFDIEITSVERMNPELEGFMDMGTMRLVKKGRNEFKISGTFYMFKTMGNEAIVSSVILNILLRHIIMIWFQANLEIIKLQKNGNDQILYQNSAGLCDFIKTEKNVYPTFLEYSNFPEPGVCPILKVNFFFNFIGVRGNFFFKGNYTLTDYEFKKEKLPPLLPAGNFLVKLYYTSEKKILAGLKTTATIKPTL